MHAFTYFCMRQNLGLELLLSLLHLELIVRQIKKILPTMRYLKGKNYNYVWLTQQFFAEKLYTLVVKGLCHFLQHDGQGDIVTMILIRLFK